jgi:hypothetical protein
MSFYRKRAAHAAPFDTPADARRSTRRQVVIVGAVSALVASLAFGGGFAYSQSNTPTYYACADSKNRVIADKITVDVQPKCSASQHVVSWNSNSQPGPPGEQGEEGPPGPPGEKGEPGSALASLDDLDGIPCRVGTPNEGTVSLTYTAVGEVHATCVDEFWTLTVSVLSVEGVVGGNIVFGRGDVLITMPLSSICDSFSGTTRECQYQIHQGETVELKAFPHPGSQLLSIGGGWVGCNSNPTPTECVFTMPSSDKTVGVAFEPAPA